MITLYENRWLTPGLVADLALFPVALYGGVAIGREILPPNIGNQVGLVGGGLVSMVAGPYIEREVNKIFNIQPEDKISSTYKLSLKTPEQLKELSKYK